MGKFDLKVAVFSSIMAVAGIGLLVQCAPKKSEAPSAGKQEKVNNTSNVVEGIDFAKLETSSDNAAKAVHKALKDKSMPQSASIALAIAEQHLKAAKKDASNDSALKLVSSIADYVSKSKITKMEELRSIYETIEATKNKKIKTGNRENNIYGLLENAEISAYSGSILIATAWLNSSVPLTKPVAIISSGSLKLGEIRADQKVVAFLATEKGTNTEDLGKLEEITKTGTIRVIPLNLFLIHEALKSYAVNQHEWANKILNTAASELKIKIAAEAVVATTLKADPAKIEESVLLYGKLTELVDGQIVDGAKDPKKETPAKPAEAGSDSATKPKPATDPKAGEGSKTIEPPKSAEAGTDNKNGQAEKPAPLTNYEFKINGVPKSYAELKKLLSEAQKKNLLAIIKRQFMNENGTVKGLKNYSASLVLARVEKFDDAQVKSVATLGPEVAKQIESALKLVKDKKVDSVVLVQLQLKTKEGAQVHFIGIGEEEQVNSDELKLIGEKITVKAELVEFLLKQAEASKIDTDNVISIELVEKKK